MVVAGVVTQRTLFTCFGNAQSTTVALSHVHSAPTLPPSPSSTTGSCYAGSATGPSGGATCEPPAEWSFAYCKGEACSDMTSCVTCTKNPSCGFCGGAVQACLDGTASKVRPVFTAAQLCCVTLCGCAPCCFDAPLMQHLYLQLFGCCAIRAPTLARLAVEHPGTMAPAKPRKATATLC